MTKYAHIWGETSSPGSWYWWAAGRLIGLSSPLTDVSRGKARTVLVPGLPLPLGSRQSRPRGRAVDMGKQKRDL